MKNTIDYWLLFEKRILIILAALSIEYMLWCLDKRHIKPAVRMSPNVELFRYLVHVSALKGETIVSVKLKVILELSVPHCTETAAFCKVQSQIRDWVNKTSVGKHQVFTQLYEPTQGQRSAWFSKAPQGKVTTALSPLCRDHTGTRWLPLPLLFPLSVDHLASGCMLNSICSHSQAGVNVERQMDGWEGGKTGGGKVNNRVSNESSWVSFISFRLTESQSATRLHMPD